VSVHVVSIEQKCIFVHVPKTGGQSVEQAFLNQNGLSWDARAALLLKKNTNINKGPKRLAHLLASEYVELGYVSQHFFDTSFKFSFVRNPWDRMVSSYHYQKHNCRSFKEYVQQIDVTARMLRPQSDFLVDASGKLLIDFLGRFEHLEADFQAICSKLGLEQASLPKRNMTARRSAYHSYYDAESRSIVAELYKEDTERFDYRFEGGLLKTAQFFWGRLKGHP